ncbi:MAG: hypothetical protein ACJAYU_002297 [Bradymonadia bacterium]|jgi:hypothetical protein
MPNAPARLSGSVSSIVFLALALLCAACNDPAVSGFGGDNNASETTDAVDDAADSVAEDTAGTIDIPSTDADPPLDTTDDPLSDARDTETGDGTDVGDTAADVDVPPSWIPCGDPAPHVPVPNPDDCNDNGDNDATDIEAGYSLDCDGDGVPDECQRLDDSCVTFGAREFVEHNAGNLPIIISMPHGGLVAPDDVPDRVDATNSRDVNTIQLGRAIDAALFEATGRHAHLVIVQLHRNKLDANRSVAGAHDGHPEMVQAWTEYHSYIEAAKRSVEQQFGGGLYIDLHGLVSVLDKLEFGYLIDAAQLYLDDDRLDHPGYSIPSSARSLAAATDRPFSELIRGFDSLGGSLEAAGFPSVPSPANPDPGYNDDGSPGNYFNGGYNTSRHGSRDGGVIDGVQLEANWAGVRDSPGSRERFGEAFAAALLRYLPEWYGIDPMGRALVEVWAADSAASELGDPAELLVRRSGDLSAPLNVRLDWTGDAAGGRDIDVLPTTIDLDAGSAELRVPITARGDGETEGSESLRVEVLPGPGYNVGRADKAAFWVGDAETTGVTVAVPEDVVEGDSTELLLWRDRCGGPTEVVLTFDGQALAGSDFTVTELDGTDLDVTELDSTRLTVNFAPDAMQVAVTVEVDADGLLEGRETLRVAVDSIDSSTPPTPHNVGFDIIDGDTDPALLAWWNGRSLDGALVDIGTWRHDGALLPPMDGPSFDEGGPVGRHLVFDGDDDVVIADDIALGDAFTVSFWFRAAEDMPTGFRYVYGHGKVTQPNHVNVYILDDGRLRTSVRGAADASDYEALDTTPGLRDDAWHHYALVVRDGDSPSATVYVDGAEAASASRGAGGVDPSREIYLGGRWDLSPDRDWRGDLDEVRIHARALSVSEIALLGGR